MFVKIIAVLVLYFIACGITGYFLIKKRIKLITAGALFAALAITVVTALVLPESRAYLNFPSRTPEEAAETFCNAVGDNDGELALSALEGKSSLYTDEKFPDEASEYLFKILMDSLELTVTGEAESGWNSVKIPALLKYPDLASMKEKTVEAAAEAAERIASERARSVVYNADKTYLPEIIEEAYLETLEDIKNYPLCEEEIELYAVCESGSWRIISDEPVSDAILKSFSEGRDIREAVTLLADEERAGIAGSAEYVSKHYTIDFSDTVSPEPDPARYGTTQDPAEVQAVVEAASELLGGQELVWTPETEIFPGTDINYYFDDTILAIVWREAREGSVCTWAEIKIADASQLRRKLADDTFNPPTSSWKEATILSEEANAVVATGSDLYAFRDTGIFSYGGTLYRCKTNLLDSCHITSAGDMLFTRRYELSNWDEAQQWITDNDIMFSLSFGPVLIENGEPVITWEYSVGEIWEGYARAAMGQLGEKGSLHYLMVSMASDSRISTNTVTAFRDPTLLGIQNAMIDKGCTQAYALDGGQTGAIIINNEMINRPTYGWERIYCDILYFATALTPEERLG